MKNTLVTRTENFASNVRSKLREIPWTAKITDDLRQLLRSSGSVAANYIEAQEALSRDDFIYRIRVCRKEARESTLWLSLLKKSLPIQYHTSIDSLYSEAEEFVRMFTAIAKKMESKK